MKRTVVIFLALAMLLSILLMASCTNANIQTNESQELTIFLPKTVVTRQMSAIIEEYNNKISNNTISGRKIAVTEYELSDAENTNKKIINTIMSGEGPDLILIDNWLGYYVDVEKASSQNCFANLDPLIKNSEDFKIDLFNKQALDAGIIAGKRVLLPYSFSLPLCGRR